MHCIPSIYANDELYNRFKNPEFFNPKGLGGEVTRNLNNLLEADTFPENFTFMLAQIKQSAVPEHVKVAINDYAYCLHLTNLLFNKDKNSLQVFDVIEQISEAEFDKSLIYGLAVAKFSDEVAEIKDLRGLIPYINTMKKLGTENKLGLDKIIFHEVAMISKIKQDDMVDMALMLKDLQNFIGIRGCDTIITTFLEVLMSKIEGTKEIMGFAEDIKTHFTIDSEEVVSKALNIIRKFPFDSDFMEKFREFDVFFRAYEKAYIDESKITVSQDDRTIIDRTIDADESMDLFSKLPITDISQITMEASPFVNINVPGKKMKLYKALIKVNNGEELIVCVKINTTHFKDTNLEGQAYYIALMQDSINYLKLYGAFWIHEGDEWRYHLVMELCKESLNDRIKAWDAQKAPRELRKDMAWEAAQSLCRAICELNKHSISHRDIKPDNILITHEGIYKVADFDISKKTERNNFLATMTCVDASMVGTLKYMAPELRDMHIKNIATKNINFNRCDVYSLGLTIMRMFTSEMEGWWNTLTPHLQNDLYNYVDEYVKEEKFNELLKKMLKVEPNERSSFGDLVIFLNKEVETGAAF